MTKTISAVIVVLLLVVGLPLAPAAQAVPTDVGYRDFSFAASGVSAPTGQKPQSKLWFADGSWWGALFSVGDSAFTVHRLDWGTQTWSNTGTVIDTRNNARVDTLWDGNALYTVSGTTGTTGVAQVRRFNYDSGTGAFSLASGFPVTVSPKGAESFVFDKDASGNLWVTWTQDLAVYVTHSSGSETNWVSPFVLPFIGAANLTADDTSAVVAFGSSIGVMWSNQNSETMYFAIHANGAADNDWILKPAVALPEYADDHMNIKSLQSTSDGRVFATTKTSLNNSSAPLILLLTMSPQGNWSRTTFGTVAENHTRPLLLLDEANDRIFLFAASPCCSGGTVYYKETSMTNPSFAPGLGNIFIQSSLDPKINNISSTKQPLTAESGLLAIAGDDSTKFYLHNALSLGGGGDTVPPQTTISSGPNLTTGDSTAAFTFVSNEPVSTFECSIDSGPFSGCTSPNIYTGLAIGPHRFEVRATDLAANVDPTPATWDWTIGPQSTFTPTADTYIDAGKATTNFGGAPTLISDGGTKPREALLRFDVTGLSSPVLNATLRVWVTNPTGNGPEVFPASNSWSESTVTWDTKPARTGGAIFDAGAIASGTWYEFDVTAQVIGNGTFTFNLASISTDGVKFDSREATVPPQLVVQADSAPDSAPPTVSTVDPLSGAVDVPVTSVVTGVFSEPIDPTTISASSFTLSDGGAVPGIVTYDATTMTATLTPDTPLSLATTYTATIATAVQDLAGNALAGPVTWSFATPAADTTPPETTITSGPTPTTSATSGSFVFDASEPGSTFECSLDSGAFQACTSPATFTGLALGAHHFEVRATDLASNTDPTPATWDWTIDSSATIDVSITSGTDDAEQRSNGSVTVTSSDLELVEVRGRPQVVGMRFSGLGIPQGATINRATLQFTVDEVSIDPALLTIRTEAADNPGPFTTGSFDISSRATSVTAVAWNPAPWPTIGQSSTAQITPDLAPIVQSAVNRPGWASGNALVFIVDGSGARVADSYNGNPSGAPKLHIEYDATPPSVAPTVTSFTPTSGSPTTPVTITGSAFNATTQVAFNGTVASFTVTSDTSIDTQVPVGATTGPISVTNAAGTGTSTNDFTVVPRITVVATDASAAEPGTDTGTFSVTRTGPTDANLIVSYSVSGTATPGTDYTTLSGTVTIPIGQAATTLTVTPLNDTVPEPVETVDVALDPDPAYTVGVPATGTVTITDDDATQVTVVATDASAAEPGTDTGTFAVTRTGPTDTALTVFYSVSGTATPGTDYTTLSGTVTIPIGQATAILTVTPLNDTVPEPVETVAVALDPDPAYTVGVPNTGTVTITDDDNTGVLTFIPVADTYIDEGLPTTNFGSDTSLSVDGNAGSAEEALVKFDISGVTGGVQSAVLRVYVTNATSNGPTVVPTATGWDEGTVTWNNKPSPIGGVIFDAGAIPSGAWYEFDVTSWVTGNGTLSFNLVAQSSNGMNFNSREAPSTVPELVVTASSTPDTTPPTVAAATPSGGAVDVTVSTIVTATFNEAMNPASINATSFTLSDGGVVAASVTYDAATMTATLTPDAPLSLAATYSATITAAAQDVAGNPLAATTWTFTTAATDTDPPETTISTGPSSETGSTAASFAFGSDEPGSSFACSLDGGSFSPCSSPVTYSGLSMGAHHFEVRATDSSSNTDPTPATWDWTISATLTFLPVADAYVSDSRPTTNYGAATEIISDGGPAIKEALLRFDVAGVSGTVQSAVLRIYATNGSWNGPEVFPAGNGWDELTVTWATRPARTGGAVFDAGRVLVGAWYEFDVTALIAGDGTVTFNLASVSSDAAKFQSREVAGFEPQLVITTG